uniref:Uncharacterized protein n=1 Tax=Timema cristinae TaxID=61476 RepID=A0A7R9DK31_TIMCR|nr:unnamed protein product [Timema cristinae]
MSKPACVGSATTMNLTPGSVATFAWRVRGKPFWETSLSTPDRDSNLDLPANGSPVYCESSAFDHVATEAEHTNTCQCLETLQLESVGFQDLYSRAPWFRAELARNCKQREQHDLGCENLSSLANYLWSSGKECVAISSTLGKAIARAMLRGLIDSLKGTLIIFYLDKNIKERAQNVSPNKESSSSRRKDMLHKDSSSKLSQRHEP